MMEDDDIETVLHGSELDNYLASLDLEDSFETFEPIQNKKNPMPKDDTKQEIISEENYQLIILLLNSGLMLEEDASYLFTRLAYYKYKEKIDAMLYKISLLLSLSMLIFYFWNPNSVPGRTLMITALIVFLVVIIRLILLYQTHIRKVRLLKFLQTCKDINKKLNKTMANLRNDSALILSKENADDVHDDSDGTDNDAIWNDSLKSYFERAKIELQQIITETLSILREVLILHRSVIEKLLSGLPTNVDFETTYISSLSDDQLGLSSTSQQTEDCNVTYLNVMKNRYLLMQSETIKCVGLCLTPRSRYDREVFKVIDETTEKLLKITKNFDYLYHVNFKWKKFKKEKNDNFTPSDLFSKTYSLNLSIKSLLFETEMLQSVLEKNSFEHLKELRPKIFKSLDKIHFLFSECNDSFDDIRVALLRFKESKFCESDDVNAEKDEPVLKEDVKKIVTVSEPEQDKVYLGTTDASADELISDYNPEIQPELPKNLINELKYALAGKKSEFQIRESAALKRDNLDEIQDKSFDVIKTKKKPYSYDKQQPGHSLHPDLQKFIALRAVQNNLVLNSSSEDVIGDDD